MLTFKTDQAAFDFVVRALLKQGKPAVQFNATRSGRSEDYMMHCVYRDEAGNKCAAGHVIPDDIYVAGLEGQTIDTLIKTYPALNALWPQVDILRALQCAHDGSAKKAQLGCSNLIDNSTWLEEFRSKARKIALDYSLDQTALTVTAL